MRSLRLPATVQLHEKSVVILREVGVAVSRNEHGYQLNYAGGVRQVVACVLGIEKVRAVSDKDALAGINEAIAAAEGHNS